MGSTLDLGRRIELVSMDPHCANITIALYEQPGGYVIHSYSRLPEARARLDFIRHAIQGLAGLDGRQELLAFACGAKHRLAMRRAFLEACKIPSNATVDLRPLTVLDKKLNRNVTVRSLGDGLYELTADSSGDAAASRLESIAGGYRKLAEIDLIPGEPHRFRFPCARQHDALVGLLLPRSLNVRAALREQEMAATRGTLVAPSAQK